MYQIHFFLSLTHQLQIYFKQGFGEKMKNYQKH